MIDLVQKGMPLRLSRYELKFKIPLSLIDPISDFAQVYCNMDKYSQISENGFYRVNNLYFDSMNYLFLRKRLERSENRFNMRVRSYGNDPGLPYFLEIKQKISGVVRKFRARVDNEDWYKVFLEPGFDFSEESDQEGERLKNHRLFTRLLFSYGASPKVLTQYLRKAFVSNVDDYARVTFDVDLRYQPEESYNLIPDENLMASYDNPNLFDPDCNVILELKCYTSQVPLWMLDMIRTFNLKRTSFSKYTTGVTEVLNLYKYDLANRKTAFF